MKTLSTRLSTLRRSVPFSLRLQLTVWYTTAFAVLLLLIFYQYLERSLEASVDTDLQIRAQQTASLLVLQQGTLTLRDLTVALPGFGTTTSGPQTPQADVNQGALVRLLAGRGRLLGETPAFRELQVPAES